MSIPVRHRRIFDWIGLRPVWGKGQQRVRGAMENIRRQLPFGMHKLHTDNRRFASGERRRVLELGIASLAPGDGYRAYTGASLQEERSGLCGAEELVGDPPIEDSPLANWWATTATAPRQPTSRCSGYTGWLVSTSISSSR